MPGNPFYQSKFWINLKRECLERDHYRCTVDGCSNRATFADHIATRPRWVTGPTSADVLSNLRSLCRTHDNQIKENAVGKRANGGVAYVHGCGLDGRPLDPNHPWNRK